LKKGWELHRAETAAYNAIRDQLLISKNKDDLPNIVSVAKAMVNAAIKNPNGRAAAIVAPAIGFSPDLLKKLDEEIEKTQARDKDFLRYRVHKQFFDKQRDVLFDTEARRKCLIIGRRGGKTEVLAGLFCQTAVIDNSPMLYINLNFKNAIKQMWERVKTISANSGLVIVKEDKTNGIIEWANGSSLMFGGNTTTADQDKYRGFKYRLVGIDECGQQRWLRTLVDEIITPTLLDFEDSILVLQGTPPRVPKTFFESMWNSAAFKRYTWSIFDNKFIPDPLKEIRDMAEKRGLSLESPFIQREYFAAVGSYDLEAMVYKDRKYHTDPPDYKITDIAIGIDYGFSDYNAIMGLAYNRELKKGYFFFEQKFNKSNVSQIVAVTKDAIKQAEEIALKHNMDKGNIEIVADTNEESITYELATTYRLPARNAYKYNKEMAIYQFADCLRAGQITMKQGGFLDEEMETLIFMRDEEDNILPIIDDDIGGHPDAADAALYAFRQFAFYSGLEIAEGEDNGAESS
jgi:hypothetical protein